MKKLILVLISFLLSACASYSHRPIQDQVVGGTSLLDAITGRDRIGVIAKQAHYDLFIARPINNNEWYFRLPLINAFNRPIRYEICQAPPADAMASTASSLASALKVAASEGTGTLKVDVEGQLAESFANKVSAFTFRTQGIQYIRDIKFDNCLTWQNRGELTEEEEIKLKIKLKKSNAEADKNGKELILKELELRASTNNFGASSAEVSKETIAELIELTKANKEAVKELMKKVDEESKESQEGSTGTSNTTATPTTK